MPMERRLGRRSGNVPVLRPPREEEGRPKRVAMSQGGGRDIAFCPWRPGRRAAAGTKLVRRSQGGGGDRRGSDRPREEEGPSVHRWGRSPETFAGRNRRQDLLTVSCLKCHFTDARPGQAQIAQITCRERVELDHRPAVDGAAVQRGLDHGQEPAFNANTNIINAINCLCHYDLTSFPQRRVPWPIPRFASLRPIWAELAFRTIRVLGNTAMRLPHGCRRRACLGLGGSAVLSAACEQIRPGPCAFCPSGRPLGKPRRLP